MVAERTQKNEIFNMLSEIEEYNEEILRLEIFEEVRNLNEMNEAYRTLEQRREEIIKECDLFKIPCDWSITLMTDEEWNEFINLIYEGYDRKTIIDYCEEYGITYKETLLNMSDAEYDELIGINE